jgi:tetratricopeptide (TPR) repeat protein
MRSFLVCLVILIVPLPAWSDEAALKQARFRLLHGNYAEARQLYQRLLKDENDRIAAAIGISRCCREEGEYDQALAVLEAALKEAPKDSNLLAEKADLLLFRGQWLEARKAAKLALEGKEEQFLARWVLARLYRDEGKLKDADANLLWFIRTYTRHENDEKSITDPQDLLHIGLAAVERARKHRGLQDQFQFVLKEVWGLAAKSDKDFWPAEFHRGLLYQEKFRYDLAAKAFNKALTINPRAAEVLTAKGVSALHNYRIEDAELFAEHALQINRHLPAALRLKADIFLTAGDTARAMPFLEKARNVNPRSEETLARMAACYHLERNKDKLEALIRKVGNQNPRAVLFYHDLAQRLEERKHYYDAEKYYQLATKLEPRLPESRHQLGILYMRLGKEDLAFEVLDLSFKDDPFNVRVYNTLEVLETLKKYTTLKTQHFILRYDPKNDRLLAHFIAKYLEDIYGELAEQFQYRPKEPILVELFSKHTMFSGRIVALPDLHTVGACTGKMMAMVSTNDQSHIIPRPFNWNRVLRHELVHIFNLEQTGFLVPHWFTEGLAVRNEKFPMPPQWNTLLLRRVASGKLLNLDNIHLGFIRPGSSEEWNLAYLQSKLYVDYLIKTQGQKAVGGMLDAYHDGLDTGAALRKVGNLAKAEFEKGYRAHLQDLVKDIAGTPPARKLEFNELKERLAKEPDNPDLAAELAERYLFLGNRERASELADQSLAKRKYQPVASFVKARLLLAGKQLAGAKKLLQEALDTKAPEPRVARLLGTLQFEAKNFAEAAEVFELGRKAEPYDNYWLIQLARCYQQNGNRDKLIEVLKQLAPLDADDLEARRKLAQLLTKAKRHAEAEVYARQALEIDVNDPDAQQLLQEALQAQGKEKELKELRKLLSNR